jgi:hypothetical protein
VKGKVLQPAKKNPAEGAGSHCREVGNQRRKREAAAGDWKPVPKDWNQCRQLEKSRKKKKTG